MKVYIGADHRGFNFKEELKPWIMSEGHDVEDVGAEKLDTKDDYPVFSLRVGRGVTEEKNSLGVLLCGSGAGAVAAVNKVKGVRGSVGFKREQVKAARHDDNLNVLVLAADYLSFDEAKNLVSVFLETSFNTSKERYQRRIDQIKDIEENG